MSYHDFHTHLEAGPAARHHEQVSDPKLNVITESGADDALKMALDADGETWSEEEERHVLRKIDLVVVPLVCMPM